MPDDTTHTAEHRAVRGYNVGNQLARELVNNSTRGMLYEIIKTEEGHRGYIEAQLEQIKPVGLQMYLRELVD